MTLLTEQQLIDAAADTQTIEDVANGASGNVTSRLGTVHKTLGQVIAELAAQDIGSSAAALINQDITQLNLLLGDDDTFGPVLRRLLALENALTAASPGFLGVWFGDFDDNQHISFTDLPNANYNTSFTFDISFITPPVYESGRSYHLLNMGDTTNGVVHIRLRSSTGDVTFQVGNGSNAADWVGFNTTPNTEYRMQGNYNHSSDTITLTVNGVAVSGGGEAIPFGLTPEKIIGNVNQNGASGFPWKGVLKSFQLGNMELEIPASKNGTNITNKGAGGGDGTLVGELSTFWTTLGRDVPPQSALVTSDVNHNSVSVEYTSPDAGSADIPVTLNGAPVHPLVYEPNLQRHFGKMFLPEGQETTIVIDGDIVVRETTRTKAEPGVTTTVTASPDGTGADMSWTAALAAAEASGNYKIVLLDGTYPAVPSQLHQQVFTKGNIVIAAQNPGNVTITAELDISSWTYTLEGSTTDVYECVNAPTGLEQIFFNDGGTLERLPATDGAGKEVSGGATEWTLATLDASPLGGFFYDGSTLYVKLPAGGSPDGLLKTADQTASRCFQFNNGANLWVEGISFDFFTNNTTLEDFDDASGLDFKSCTNYNVVNCKFRWGASTAISTQNCTNGLIENCESIDGQSYQYYLQARHSGWNRGTGAYWIESCRNLTIRNNTWTHTMVGCFLVDAINVDLHGNTLTKVRNNCFSMRGDGHNTAVWNNTFVKCGNPMPSNEESSLFGPTWYINNTATETGWDGDVQVQAVGLTSGTSQGNRFGSTDTGQTLGIILSYYNTIVVDQIDAGTTSIAGLQLADRKHGPHRIKNNIYEISYDAGITSDIVRFFGSAGDLAILVGNVDFDYNQYWWDKGDDTGAFYLNGDLTFSQYQSAIQGEANSSYSDPGVNASGVSSSAIADLSIDGITNNSTLGSPNTTVGSK